MNEITATMITSIFGVENGMELEQFLIVWHYERMKKQLE